LVEGAPDVLIENGTVCAENCRRELITVTELESAAHKQGLSSLNEVERAVLEPGGTIAFLAKKPTPETARHVELLSKLEALSSELTALRRESIDRPRPDTR